MALRLDARDRDFEQGFRNLLAMKREVAEDVDSSVKDIIAEVVARGDAALIELTRRFDRVALEPETLRIGEAEIEAALERCTPEALDALRLAKERIEAYHHAQKPRDHSASTLR